jgi:hypothetical protein
MSFREIDKNGNGQGKDTDSVDLMKFLAKQQEANKPATDKDGYNQGENNGSRDYIKKAYAPTK